MPLDPDYDDLMQHWERLKAEVDELAFARQGAIDFFESLPDPGLITDAFANVKNANPAARILLGITGRLLRPLASYITPSRRRSFRLDFAAYQLGATPADWRTGTGTGTDKAFHIAVRPMGASRMLCWVLHPA